MMNYFHFVMIYLFSYTHTHTVKKPITEQCFGDYKPNARWSHVIGKSVPLGEGTPSSPNSATIS